MSRRADNQRNASREFSYSLKEFREEWETLKLNADQFLRDIDSGNDINASGTVVKMSSYRISILSAEIMTFTKAMKR
jgi:hypothetical protein